MNPALDDSIPLHPRKLPVLIVTYCRAQNLRNLLEGLINTDRRVYVVIDKASERLIKENQEVIQCARSFEGKLDITIHINRFQAGVKMGVPTAIDFVLSIEEDCIILEDDCILTPQALEYFDEMSLHLGKDISLISGDSPWSDEEMNVSTISCYPLIWGWATNRAQWKKLKIFVNSEVPWVKVLVAAIKYPQQTTSIAYFLSAQIKVKRGKLQAWDCSVALGMLVQNLKCIVPNLHLVINIGNDEFAHHTLDHNSLHRKEIKEANPATTEISFSKHLEKKTNKAIASRIYRMRRRHILSPIKALF
jgi:hypothetical protein